jgi:hypothetical protein
MAAMNAVKVSDRDHPAPGRGGNRIALHDQHGQSTDGTATTKPVVEVPRNNGFALRRLPRLPGP